MYELTAAIASNAVSIGNDVDHERACRMYSVALRLYEDLRSTLVEKLATVLRRKVGDAPAIVKRAFAGGLPLQPGETVEELPLALSKLGKHGSVVKAVARPSGRVLSNSRAHSLARLTREWRESSALEARRTGRDVIIHHLGREFDMDDEESVEILGLLEGAASGRGSEDPLSRLLASVQNRRERRSGASALSSRRESRASEGSRRDSDGNTSPARRSTNAKSNSQVTKESLDICDRLYALMREAEREAHLLEYRIDAWRRLETDSLVRSDDEDANASGARPTFDPSECSACASPMALQLLSLWLKLLEMDPSNVEVTKGTVQMLLSEDFPIVYKTLMDAKRRAVKRIALVSEQGAQLVLEALRLRLHASEDVASSEILGSIIEEGGPPAFLDLAMEILENTAIPK